jgi:hypothetical protein
VWTALKWILKKKSKMVDQFLSVQFRGSGEFFERRDLLTD